MADSFGTTVRKISYDPITDPIQKGIKSLFKGKMPKEDKAAKAREARAQERARQQAIVQENQASRQYARASTRHREATRRVGGLLGVNEPRS